MSVIYYFGCSQRSGHYLFEAEDGWLRSCRLYTEKDFERFGNHGARLDGLFCPPSNWSTQLWMESAVGPWRIISWWDNSIDTRPGSHSTFVGKGYASGEELLAAARPLFREVFDRQRLPMKGVFP